MSRQKAYLEGSLSSQMSINLGCSFVNVPSPGKPDRCRNPAILEWSDGGSILPHHHIQILFRPLVKIQSIGRFR